MTAVATPVRGTRVTRAVGLVAVACALALAAGCAGPAGTDGDLTDDWAAMPAPKPYQPTAPACFTDDLQASIRLPEPVDCQRGHRMETFFSGTFTGADAARTTTPPTGSAERRRAFEQCMTATTTFLGDDWRNGRLELTMTVASQQHWEGGGRWFRCDLVVRDENGYGDIATRVASLKGTLAGDRPMARGCNPATENAANRIEFKPGAP